MGLVKTIAAAALILAPQVLAPSIAGAQAEPEEDSEAQVGELPTAGGVAPEALPTISAGSIPTGAYIAGGFVIAAGIVIGILAADGGSDPSTTPTTN